MNKHLKKGLLIGLFTIIMPNSSLPMSFILNNGTKKSVSSCFNTNNRTLQSRRNIHIFTQKNASKKPLTEAAHKKAYLESLKYEYPTAPFLNNHYNPTTCETSEIRSALNTIDKNIDVIWIPRTLYELFIIDHYENNFTQYKGYTQELEQDNINAILKINHETCNIALHRKINDYICTFVEKHSEGKKPDNQEFFIHIAKKVINSLPKDIQELEEEIINAIIKEYRTHKENPEIFLLYRSGHLDERDFNTQANYALNHTPKTSPGQLPRHVSLSFGMGFFSGYYTDYGACPAKISSRDTKSYSYTLPINKKKSIKGETPFFTPPLSPICNFFSQGEAFHARTRLPHYISKPDGWHSIKNPFPRMLAEKSTLRDHFINRKKSDTHYKDLYTYIINNASPLNIKTEKTIEKIKNKLSEE